MNHLRGWKIATIRGVPVYLHVSLLFLLFYVILIAGAQFPSVARESGVDLRQVTGTPFGWGFIFAVTLFVSVLLHEFGHVLAAQALGTKVRSITLLMLGGISQMERMPEAKYAEFKISIAGPLVSLGIAAGLFALERLSGSVDLVLFSYWLSRANLVLAIFNLLPAFPTDGGRVLRSILSARQGKLRATRTAVQVSQVFAWLFGIIGLLQFNFLLILIAFFVYSGARAELAAISAQTLLRGIRAGAVGRRIEPVSDDLSLEALADFMVRTRNPVVPVTTASGGFAVIDADQINTVPGKLWPQAMVRDVMRPTEHAIDANTPLDEALEHGLPPSTGGIPIMEQGKIVGILRNSDVAEMIVLRSLEEGLSWKGRFAA